MSGSAVVMDPQTGEILGVHMVGPEGTEMIAEFSIARLLEATSAEGGRAIHPVNVRVGGFYRVPTRRELQPLRDRLRTMGAR